MLLFELSARRDLMQLQNKNRISYLGALTLLFAYAEMLLPRIIPFFRIGLGNIVILLALDLNLPAFIFLTVIKSIASSMMSGTLISPFFIISFCQSVVSGLVMLGFYKIKGKWLSIYGISMIGSAVSAVIQLLLASFYLGNQTMALLGPMLLFSLAAAIVTAFLSLKLKIPTEAPVLTNPVQEKKQKGTILLVILILATTVACFMLDNIWILTGALILAFIFQILSGRKILLLPHISMWIFVILVNLISPSGKVLVKFADFSITKGSLIDGVIKALKLSIASALSQCAASLRPSENSIIGLSLAYYRGLSDKFRKTDEKLLKRLQLTLSATEL